jgi:hypothetical protein
MQIDIRPGKLYFLKGKEEARVNELAAGLRSGGYRLLIVSSRDPGAVKDDLEAPAECIRTLTESAGPYCVDPENLTVLTDTVIKFTEQGGPTAFLIEDLGLLKQKNEFPKVLRMVGFLYESVALHRGIGIIVIDTQSWDSMELAFLGKEGTMVEEKDRLEMRSLQPGTRNTPPSQNV